MRFVLPNREGHLHPLTLVVLTVLFSFLVFLADRRLYCGVLLLSFLVLFDVSLLACLKRLGRYLFFYALMLFFSRVDLGYATGAFLGLFALLLRLFPIFNVGKVLLLTSPTKLLAAMRQIRLPYFLSVGLVTALRFLDEMQCRVREIKNGMRLRELHPSLLHPVRTFELYLVPLVYKCLHVSETLTSSLLAKGILYEGEKTSYHDLSFGLADGASLALSLLFLGVALWM